MWPTSNLQTSSAVSLSNGWAEIPDAGLELHHCAGFSFDRAAARRLDRSRCSGCRNVHLLRHPRRDACTRGDRATRPLNDRSVGLWPIIFRKWRSNGAAKPAKSVFGGSAPLESLAFSSQCFIETYPTKQFCRG